MEEYVDQDDAGQKHGHVTLEVTARCESLAAEGQIESLGFAVESGFESGEWEGEREVRRQRVCALYTLMMQ